MDVKAKFTLGGIVSALRDSFPHATPWSFTSSAGISAGASIVAGAWGFLYLRNSDTKETPTLAYAAAGFGKSVGGASGSFSTPSMFSTGIGSIWTRRPGNLKAAEMAGSMIILSASSGAPVGLANNPNGVGLSVYLLSFPNPAIALFKLAEGPSALYGWLRGGGADLIKAAGMMFGVSKSTPDAGVSAIGGWSHIPSSWFL